jgi:hypothetical protein
VRIPPIRNVWFDLPKPRSQECGKHIRLTRDAALLSWPHSEPTQTTPNHWAAEGPKRCPDRSQEPHREGFAMRHPCCSTHKFRSFFRASKEGGLRSRPNPTRGAKAKTLAKPLYATCYARSDNDYNGQNYSIDSPLTRTGTNPLCLKASETSIFLHEPRLSVPLFGLAQEPDPKSLIAASCRLAFLQPPSHQIDMAEACGSRTHHPDPKDRINGFEGHEDHRTLFASTACNSIKERLNYCT